MNTHRALFVYTYLVVVVVDQLVVEWVELVEGEGLQLVEGTYQATSWEEVEILQHNIISPLN